MASSNNISCYPICFDSESLKSDLFGVIPNCGYSVDEALCALSSSTSLGTRQGWSCENDVPLSDPCATEWFGIICDGNNNIISLNASSSSLSGIVYL